MYGGGGPENAAIAKARVRPGGIPPLGGPPYFVL